MRRLLLALSLLLVVPAAASADGTATLTGRVTVPGGGPPPAGTTAFVGGLSFGSTLPLDPDGTIPAGTTFGAGGDRPVVVGVEPPAGSGYRVTYWLRSPDRYGARKLLLRDGETRDVSVELLPDTPTIQIDDAPQVAVTPRGGRVAIQASCTGCTATARGYATVGGKRRLLAHGAVGKAATAHLTLTRRARTLLRRHGVTLRMVVRSAKAPTRRYALKLRRVH